MLGLLKKKQPTDLQSIPLALRAEDGALLFTFPSEVVSGFRQMVTALVYNDLVPARIAVVAALRGEGVTYTTLALATTIASDLARSVCVVDLNWWAPGLLSCLGEDEQLKATKRKRGKKQPAQPSVHPRFANHPGIADVLADRATLDEALITTALPNLTLLPAGNLPVEHRPVVARSSKLRSLIEELSRRYDHLLLDIPAMLTTSDAIALASLSDSCCLVVRQGVTSTASVQKALDGIKHLKVLGTVLNQVTIKTPGWLRLIIPQE